MTDIPQDELELIRRYLANDLSEKEELMLMTRIIHDPRFRQEVEITAALRDGFRELEKRGKLSALLQSPARRWPRAPLALAATVAVVVVGGVVSYLVGEQQDASAPVVLVETLRFETTRGDAAPASVTWEKSDRPVRLELTFDVGPSPAGGYRVTLQSTAGEGAVTSLDQVIDTSPDGQVVLTLDGALFQPGNYDVRLEPLPAIAPSGIVTYTLRVLDGPDAGS